MFNVDAMYNEMNGLVWRGRRQGFVAGVIFSGSILVVNRVRKHVKIERRNNGTTTP